MLTTSERQKLTQHMAKLKPEARIAHIAQLRAAGGCTAEVAVLEGIHRQLCEIEQAYYAQRAAATPLEVNGQFRQTATVTPPRIEYPPLITRERVKYAAIAVAVSGSFVCLIAFVIIPVAVAVFSALVSVVPYIAGAVAALVILRELFTGGTGEKKTDSYTAESPRSSSGNVYNVYVGEGQVHVHQSGQK